MKFPLFWKNRKSNKPVDVKLDRTIDIYTTIFASPKADLLDEHNIRQTAAEWIKANLDDPLLEPVLAFIDLPLFNLAIMPRNENLVQLAVKEGRAFDVPDSLISAIQSSSHCYVVKVTDLIKTPRFGMWAARAVSYAIAAATDGIIVEAQAPVPCRPTKPLSSMHTQGLYHIGDFIVIERGTDADGLFKLWTVGMERFGLPEFQMHGVPASVDLQDASKVLGGICQAVSSSIMTMADLTLPRGQTVRVGPEVQVALTEFLLANGELEDLEVKNAGPGISIRAEWDSAKAQAQTDFVSVLPPNGYEGNQSSWVCTLIDAVFGIEETVPIIPADETAMHNAHLRAVEELPKIKARYDHGFPPGSALFIKHGFPVESDFEYMWIQVTSWNDGLVNGILINTPQGRKDLLVGQPVEVSENEIYDWLLTGPNGNNEGAYTNEALVGL